MVQVIGRYSKKEYRYDENYFSSSGDIIRIMEITDEDLIVVIEKADNHLYYNYFKGEYPAKVEKEVRYREENDRVLIKLSVFDFVITFRVVSDFISGKEIISQEVQIDDKIIQKTSSDRYDSNALTLDMESIYRLQKNLTNKAKRNSKLKEFRAKIFNFSNYSLEEKTKFLSEEFHSYWKKSINAGNPNVGFLKLEDFHQLSTNEDFFLALKTMSAKKSESFYYSGDLYNDILSFYNLKMEEKGGNDSK